MNSLRKTITAFTLCTVLLCLFSLPSFAEVRRVPADAIVEQGLTAMTVDAEGAENFRYAGQKDKMHTYVGKIKPESKLKLVIRGSLKNEKELPITGRSLLVRMQVVAKKGDTILKTQNFRKENVSNLYLNYTVPKDADTLEVIESFVLTNKSQESKFNQKVTTLNKLILSTKDEVLAAALGNQGKNNDSENKDKSDPNDKKEKGDKKDPINAEKNTGNADKNKSNGKSGKEPEINPEAEANQRLTRIVSGSAFLILLAAVGVHFFLKNRKSNQIAAERKERKERLRLQAIERQKQLPQNNVTEEADPYGLPEELPEETQSADASQHETLPQDDQQDIPQAGGLNPAAAAAGATAAVTETTEPRFCQNCGAPLKPNSRFCENCGNKV
ncbi:MAG: zinc ribbon domain-containing protein [Acidaminococcaceae bacterium]|nr:zinc ribbon domain-containing protein [Acidaminococcaceae bacterium]